jgi:hypothetical protein
MQLLHDRQEGKEYLDYGCGKGLDADLLRLDKYDPHFFPEFPMKQYDVIYCNYVLNVIPCNDDKLLTVNVMLDLLKNSPESKLYITVRRDVKKAGFTSRGTWQENVVIDGLKPIIENKSFAVYVLTKGMRFNAL